MGQLSKNAYKKLVLLYLIGKFKDGIYTSYRFQKILYFGIKDYKLHPYSFRHTENGQYSYRAREDQDSLVAINLLDLSGLPIKEDAGAKWSIKDNEIALAYSQLLPKIDSKLADRIDETIDEIGYLKSPALVDKAHQDDLLANVPFGSVIIDEIMPDFIEVPFSDDECEDLELSLNDSFVLAMSKIVYGIENTKFDLREVKKVDSLL